MSPFSSSHTMGELIADERQVLIPSGEGQLVGMLHLPEGPARPTGVVLCPPFGDERKSACRALAQLARAVAGEGWSVLRFDYWGCGECPGEFVEATLQTRLGDIAAAGEFLQKNVGAVERLCVMGLRLGATLALRAGAELPGNCAAVLIEPIAEADRYFGRILQRRKLRRSITGARTGQQGEAEVVDLDGYAIRPDTLQELRGLKLELPEYHAIDTALVVQLSFNETIRGETEHVREVLEEAGVHAVLRALVMPPFWSRIDITDTGPLDDVVLQWLRRTGL